MDVPAAQHRASVALPANLTAPALARGEVRCWLAGRGQGALLDRALLIVSELVTNAVRYARPPYRLSLRSCTRGVAVGVQDGTGAGPRAGRDDDPDAESGRGMLLVHAFADETGTRATREGKVVWAVLRHEPEPPPDLEPHDDASPT